MADENDDIRAALNNAIDSAEKDAAEPVADKAPEGVSPEPVKIGEPESSAAERARDEQGRFVKADEKAPAEPVEATKPPVAPPEPKPTAVAPAAPPAAPTFAVEGARAPQSWRPAVREKFASLPPEVQEEAIRIDREVRRTMQESADARQFFQRSREVYAPIEPMLRAQNIDPMQFTADAVQTAMALAAGPQEIKAQAIARLIKLYGVDITTLDSVLVGQAPMAGAAPQPYRDPRVDELYRTIETAKYQREQQLEVQAREQLADIENEEYFDDLREDMADLLDLAAKRNLELTPREAYNRAAMMHPEISKVLQQREAARAAVNPSGSTQRSKLAASSVKGSPEVANPNAAQSRDLRGELEAAWDAAVRSR